jgi:hypothetical protein
LSSKDIKKRLDLNVYTLVKEINLWKTVSFWYTYIRKLILVSLWYTIKQSTL